MGFIDNTTVLILTYNEEANIARTLDALRDFPEIIVVDSGSNDKTLDILKRYSNVRVIERPFDSHCSQWNFGLKQCGGGREWVLALDADYVLTPELIREIDALQPADNVSAYRTRFRQAVYGHVLLPELYPPVTTLYRKARAHYIQTGHTQRVVIDGDILELKGKIIHDDRKPLRRWYENQLKYVPLEAEYILQTPPDKLRWTARLRRKVWIAPAVVMFHLLFVKGCILNGWWGVFYAMQRTIVELMISVELIYRKRHLAAGGEK